MTLGAIGCEREKMKILMPFVAAIMMVACAGEDNLSATAGAVSAPVFHTESEAKPLPMAARR